MKKFEAEKKATSHPKMANWNPGKGNPFDYSSMIVEQKFDMPEINIMDWDADADMDALLPEIITNVNFNVHLKTVFETIKTPDQAFKLLQATEEKSYQKEKYISGREMIEAHDGSVSVKEAVVSPIKVYLDYPFGKIAEIIINPYVDSNYKKQRMDFGYVIWQVSRVYAEIYKNRWEEFGIWGHAFEDLYLEIMEIRNDNVITMFIGS